MGFTVFLNVLVLAIPIYLFQISDRVLTSRSTDTLIMLTIVIVGAVIVQVVLDAIRRFILMRTAVEVAVQLGAPILSAAARASLNGNGKDYQVLGDLQQLRSFLTSGTLLSFFDAPIAPIFLLAVFLVHPHLGYIVVVSSLHSASSLPSSISGQPPLPLPRRPIIRAGPCCISIPCRGIPRSSMRWR